MNLPADSQEPFQAFLKSYSETISRLSMVVQRAVDEQIRPLTELFSRLLQGYAEVESDIEHIVTVALGPVYKDDDSINAVLRAEFPEIDCDNMASDAKLDILAKHLGFDKLIERLEAANSTVEPGSNAIYDAVFLILNHKFNITRERFDALTLEVVREMLEAATGILT